MCGNESDELDAGSFTQLHTWSQQSQDNIKQYYILLLMKWLKQSSLFNAVYPKRQMWNYSDI